jgi:preprotein translocase subunit SecE
LAKKPGNLSAMRSRANRAKAAAVAAPAMAGSAPSAPKKRTNPVRFAQEVRAEARKITWTSRKETWITSVMVFIMVILAALFLRAVDLVLGFGVGQILKLAIGG